MTILSGVYEIQNLENGHRYIGSSAYMTTRLWRHQNDLRLGKHCNSHLQRAWDKYSKENFVFNHLLYCDPQNALFYEQMCIDGLKPEYNILPLAGSCLGIKRTEETKLKMSKAMTGISHGVGNKNSLGYHHSEETCVKMSESRLGHDVSEETRHKISLATTGQKRSDKTCKNIGLSKTGNQYRLGQTVSDEGRKNISLSKMGNKCHFGHKHTEEAKKKMSESLKRHYAELRAAL